MKLKRPCLVLCLGASALLALTSAQAQAQREGAYGSSSPPTGQEAPSSIFQTVKGAVVEASAEERALYILAREGSDGEEKFKILLDEKTKIRIEKKKGGLELLDSLPEGTLVNVTVNTATGVAVSIKVKKAKKG